VEEGLSAVCGPKSHQICAAGGSQSAADLGGQQGELRSCRYQHGGSKNTEHSIAQQKGGSRHRFKQNPCNHESNEGEQEHDQNHKIARATAKLRGHH
jgi:hypothetical protein